MNPFASALRRKSQLFVEIPPSPLHRTKMLDQQETTPFKAVPMNVDSPSTPTTNTPSSRKRKSTDASQDMAVPKDADIQTTKPKKAKTENTSKTNGNGVQGTDNDGDASKQLLRCHQCSQQYAASDFAICTFKRFGGQRCVYKYCKACLRNRYKEDLATLQSNTVESCSSNIRAEHVENEGYIYQCPRCREICDCRRCRKVKALPAVGKRAEGRSEKTSTNGALNGSTLQSVKPKNSSLPGNGSTKPVPKRTKTTATAVNPHSSKPVPHVLVPPSPYKIGPPQVPITKARRRKSTITPPKPLPQLIWTRVRFQLSFDDALERMNIREFLLRFAHLTDITRTHLEELEELATSSPSTSDEETGDCALFGWISEQALRAILIGLLTLLSKDAEPKNQAALSTAIQQIRNSGFVVVKIWAVLDSLRQAISLPIPDILPAPQDVRDRRSSSRGASGSTIVVSTSQFVPIITALIEAVLRTQTVREDFERGITQEKDIARAARELAAAENARWKDVKATDAASRADKVDKAKTGTNQKASKPVKLKGDLKADGSKETDGKPDKVDKKAAKSAHEAVVATFDHAHSLAAAECDPRFAPLGRDTEGRVYYALTPGIIERESAVELLEGKKGDIKFGRRRTVVEETERKRLKYWSWFVAVWGRKPVGAKVSTGEEGEDKNEDEDEDVEGWWGFWEPKEIASLGEWLAMKHGIDLDSKRTAKAPDDTAVLDVKDAEEGSKMSRGGRPSNASSVASSSRGRTFASLNNDSESEEEGGRDSLEGDADEEVQMRLDHRGEPVPTRRDIRVLAKGLKDYAELLEWRIKRAAKNGKDEDKVDKGKGVEKIQEIPPATFYGK